MVGRHRWLLAQVRGGTELEWSVSYYYDVCGLKLRSDIELFELRPAQPSATADIEVMRADFEPLAEARGADSYAIIANADQAYFRVEAIGQVLIEQGRRVLYQTFPDVDVFELRPLIIPFMLSCVAHVAGWIPLHVAALSTERGVVLLTGPSGHGKSTVSTTASRRLGWRLLCDDFAILGAASDTRLYFPTRTIKLYEDVADRQIPGVRAVRPPTKIEVKRHFPVDCPAFIDAMSIQAIVSLDWAAEFSVNQLSPSRSFELLLGAVQSPYMARATGNLASLRSRLLQFAGQLRSFVIARDRSAQDSLDLVLNTLEKIKDGR